MKFEHETDDFFKILVAFLLVIYLSNPRLDRKLVLVSSTKIFNYLFVCELKKKKLIFFFYPLSNFHVSRTGVLRPTTGPNYMGSRPGKRSHPKTGQLYFYHGYHDGASTKHKRKPPKGMYINHDDVVKLATQSKVIQNSISNQNSASNFSNPTGGSNFSLLTSCQQTINNSFPQTICNENHPDDLLASMDREIVMLWSQVRLLNFIFCKPESEVDSTCDNFTLD